MQDSIQIDAYLT
jgi:hypothetical protein